MDTKQPIGIYGNPGRIVIVTPKTLSGRDKDTSIFVENNYLCCSCWCGPHYDYDGDAVALLTSARIYLPTAGLSYGECRTGTIAKESFLCITGDNNTVIDRYKSRSCKGGSPFPAMPLNWSMPRTPQAWKFCTEVKILGEPGRMAASALAQLGYQIRGFNFPTNINTGSLPLMF